MTILKMVARLKRRCGHCFCRLRRFGPRACNRISLFYALSITDTSFGKPFEYFNKGL